MSASSTKLQIVTAVERLVAEVPSLGKLTLVVKLELAARGGDAPIWRVEVPGSKVERDPAADARLHLVIHRQRFNEIATDGSLRDWARAYERGDVKVSGDSAVVKLLGSVVNRQLTRSGR